MPPISQTSNYQNRTIAAGESKTSGIDIRGYRSGAVYIPGASGWTAADLAFEAAASDESVHGLTPEEQPTPTYALVRGSTGASIKVSSISADGWFKIPDEVFAHAFIKAKSQNTGSEAVVAQADARQLVFVFKS